MAPVATFRCKYYAWGTFGVCVTWMKNLVVTWVRARALFGTFGAFSAARNWRIDHRSTAFTCELIKANAFAWKTMCPMTWQSTSANISSLCETITNRFKINILTCVFHSSMSYCKFAYKCDQNQYNTAPDTYGASNSSSFHIFSCIEHHQHAKSAAYT